MVFEVFFRAIDDWIIFAISIDLMRILTIVRRSLCIPDIDILLGFFVIPERSQPPILIVILKLMVIDHASFVPLQGGICLLINESEAAVV